MWAQNDLSADEVEQPTVSGKGRRRWLTGAKSQIRRSEWIDQIGVGRIPQSGVEANAREAVERGNIRRKQVKPTILRGCPGLDQGVDPDGL